LYANSIATWPLNRCDSVLDVRIAVRSPCRLDKDWSILKEIYCDVNESVKEVKSTLTLDKNYFLTNKSIDYLIKNLLLRYCNEVFVCFLSLHVPLVICMCASAHISVSIN